MEEDDMQPCTGEDVDELGLELGVGEGFTNQIPHAKVFQKPFERSSVFWMHQTVYTKDLDHDSTF